MTDKIQQLQKRLGFEFANRDLLIQALTHCSCVQEGGEASNERLEFLGDAILGAVVSEYLYQAFPDWSEGDLTRAKAALVSEPTLAAVGRRLKLGKALRLSKGEEQSGGRERSSILCGAVEALVAAIYLEAGLAAARESILRWLAEPLGSIVPGEQSKDYKTLLQEILQESHRTLPAYRVMEESGPDHDKTFVIEVCLGKEILGVGVGKSKKEAEQSAARQALERRENGQN